MLARSSPRTAATGFDMAVSCSLIRADFLLQNLKRKPTIVSIVEVLMKPLERPFDTFENMAPA